MNTIDQRILVPTAPEIIWDFISHIENNPQWQADCRSIAFITTIQQGQGTRWRVNAKNRRDYVVEITAWYDRLGYEYKIVDGVPYKENRGRLRLQETPEGTIVQWTFTYALAGAFSGLRNALSTRRSVENVIVESLWELWRQTSQRGKSTGAVFEAKSLMRDAPDVEARLSYKPRHSSTASEELHQKLAAEEPPIVQADTKPRAAQEEAPAPSLAEPDFLAEIKEEAPSADAPPSSTPTPAVEQDETRWQPETPTPPASKEPHELPRVAEPSDNPLDTSQISVFDLFGLPKPSETQEIKPVPVEENAPVAATPPPAEPVPAASNDNAPITMGDRRGLRVKLRRKLIKVRLRK